MQGFSFGISKAKPKVKDVEVEGSDGLHVQDLSNSIVGNESKEFSEFGKRRKTSHVIIETANNEWYIVSSLSTRDDTTLVAVHPETGSLHFNGERGVDVFANEGDAISHIKTFHRATIKTAIRAKALIGYVLLQSVGSGYIIAATKVRRDMQLPGGHCVYTIIDVSWIKIDLFYLCSVNKQEQKNIEIMQDFPLEELHYYCETYDITRPYPSPYPSHDYSEEYCWNDWLAKSFKTLGLRQLCVVLLQGAALSKLISLESSSHNGIYLASIARKSRINAGTRYYARGLNKESGPGNECECELIMWSGITEINWKSFVWRRGTVPIWWHSEMKSVGESRVIIDDHPFLGADKYYKNLEQRYGHVPITIFNMLRGLGQEEYALTEYYERSLEEVKKHINLDFKMIKFDWHTNLKQMGSQKTIETLWSLLRPALHAAGLNSGTIGITETEPEENTEISSVDSFLHHRYISKQKGILRFNCADSLDRTNLATFFHSWQLVAEMCRQFGVLDKTEGLNEELSHFDLELPQLLNRLPRNLVGSLTEFFVHIGDVLSILYTNSPAMHSSLIRDYSPNVSSARLNPFIAIQRRYQNVVKDSTRQAQYHMLLGQKLAKYFPSLVEPEQLVCVSGYPSFCLKTVPSIFSGLKPEKWLLSDERYSEPLAWICPKGYDIIEVYIVLREGCNLKEFALTVTGGAGDASYPQLVDLYIGPYLDSLRIVLQDLIIPRCSAGTKLYYQVPAHMWAAFEGPSIYDFAETTGPGPLTRVVLFRFRGLSGSHITLGKIDLLGTVPRPTSSPYQTFEKKKKKEISIKVQQILSTLELPSNQRKRKHSSGAISTDMSQQDIWSDINRGGWSNSLGAAPEVQSAMEIEVDDMFGIPSAFQGEGSLHPLDFSLKTPTLSATLSYMGQSNQESIGNREPSRTEEDIAKGEEIYKESVRSLVQTCKQQDKAIDFTDTLELESLRVCLALSAAKRDSILLELEQFIPNFNPCRFVFYHDEKAEMRKAAKYRSAVCQDPDCRSPLGFFSQQQCYYCYGRFCSSCMSQPTKIIEFGWDKPQPVCKRCRNKLLRQADLLQSIQREIIKLKKDQPREEFLQQKVVRALHKLGTGQLTSGFDYPPQNDSQHYGALNAHGRTSFLKRKGASLAHFPAATILLSVPTKPSSAPIESVLLPETLQVSALVAEAVDSYWSAPAETTSVEILVVLPAVCVVNSFSVIVDELGYTQSDAPLVTLMYAKTIPNWKTVGTWNFADYSKTGLKIESKDYLRFNLDHAVECRMVSFHFKLPPEEQRAQAAKAVPFLHLGRLLIFGHKISEYRFVSSAARERDKARTTSPTTNVIRTDMPEKESRNSDQPMPNKSSFAQFSETLSPEASASVVNPNRMRKPGILSSRQSLHTASTTPMQAPLRQEQLRSSMPTSTPTQALSNFLFSGPLSSLQHQPLTIRNVPLMGKDRATYDQILATPSHKTYNQVSPLWALYRNGKQMIDIAVELCTITGFVVLVRHGEEGVSSQVKLIRVLGIVTGDSKGAIVSFSAVGRFVVPKAKAKTYLCFEFPVPQRVNVLTFQFLSNYGAKEIQPPKIYLFNTLQT